MKTYAVRIYAPDGTFLGCPETSGLSDFEMKLDGGQGELTVTLPGPDAPYSPFATADNVVELWVSDGDVAGEPARIVYSGYVSRVRRDFGARPGATLTCLGHVARLSLDVYRNGTTTTITHTAAKLGAIVADVLAKFRAYAKWPRVTAQVGYDLDVAAAPTVTYVFEQKTYREAVDACRMMASGGERWYVGADGRFRFRIPDAAPTHVLTIGRHFHECSAEENMEGLRTQALYWNGVTGAGEVYKLYTSTPGFNDHGALVERIQDYGITAAAAADAAAAKFLAETSYSPTTVRLTVLDSRSPQALGSEGYDIESIEPGDTMRICGLDEVRCQFLRQAMVVTRVVYRYGRADVDLDVIPSGLDAWQRRSASRQDAQATKGSPTSYTT